MLNGTFGIITGWVAVGIISLILVISIIKAIKENDSEIFTDSLLITFFVSIFAVILPLCFGYLNRHNYYETYEEVLYEKIESVDRGSDIEGHFSLFGGTINQDIAYYFYIEAERGYELRQVTVKNDRKVYLLEDNSQTPHIVEKKEVGSYAYVQIIVPVGTVVKEYKG